MSTSRPIVALLAIFVAATSAVPYSKYGRSCKDIGCRSDEVCVMAEDPCSISQRDLCGRYPTCQRSSSGGGESCTTKVCPTGQYCKTENGRPTCVNTTPALTPEKKRPGYQPTPVKPKPVVPTPPPRSSSMGNRQSGHSGHRNTIGSSSLWDRLFGGGGGGGSSSPSSGGGFGGRPSYGGSSDGFGGRPSYGGGSSVRPSYGGGFGTRTGSGDDYRKPTSKPATNYYPGGKDYYTSHTTKDEKGNRVWTFSG